MCGTKNFVSVRLYSAPQSHWTIVAIFGICAFGEPVQAGSFAAIKSYPLPGLACSTSLERQAAGSVWDAYWSLDEANLCRWQRRDSRALFVRWLRHREPIVRGFAKTETALLLQRTITPRFSDQSGVARSTDGRYSGVLGVPHALQILNSNLPPDSVHFG